MTEIDTDKLRALAKYLGDPPLGGNHYVGSQYAIARMKEAAATILAMAEERKRYEAHRNDLADMLIQKQTEIGALKAEVELLREALERCAQIVARHNYRQNEKVDDVVLIAHRALGKDK